jgi:hypothetical protein
MQFIIETVDTCTECTTREFHVEVMDVRKLATILAFPDFDPNSTYDLDEADLMSLSKHFGLPLQGETWGRISPRRWFDDLPYHLHTDRELALMLTGMKPLAAFVGEYPPHPDIEEIPDRLFDPYVADGRFTKREFVELKPYGRVLGLRVVLYSLPCEAWRIDAYILLRSVADKTGWNEALERMEGALLGYEEWQNDAYFAAKDRQQR